MVSIARFGTHFGRLRTAVPPDDHFTFPAGRTTACGTGAAETGAGADPAVPLESEVFPDAAVESAVFPDVAVESAVFPGTVEGDVANVAPEVDMRLLASAAVAFALAASETLILL